MNYRSKMGYCMILGFLGVFCLTLSPLAWGEEIRKLPIPNIEELTEGKVKIGDTIDKSNVDLIKDYILPGTYEQVLRGMIMIMGQNLPPEELLPSHFNEATKKNQGKAIMDENGIVYYEQKGNYWPGGIPFADPKTGLEVAANFTFGLGHDNMDLNMDMKYVNKRGEIEKHIIQKIHGTNCTARLKVPPLGVVPGFEGEKERNLIVTIYPHEQKGTGVLFFRKYDYATYSDEGFVYVPFFKRVIRINANTFQDNVGGSDVTLGDRKGILEPLSNFKIKLLETKYLLIPSPEAPDTKLRPDEGVDFFWEHDVGFKFIRDRWCISPMHILEAIPTIKHIYSKKIVAVYAPPYWGCNPVINPTEMYDRQGALWRNYLLPCRTVKITDGEPYVQATAVTTYDVQADHATNERINWRVNWAGESRGGYGGLQPADQTLKKLLKFGR